MKIEFVKALNIGGGYSNTDLDVIIDGEHVGRIYFMALSGNRNYNLILRREDKGFFFTQDEAKAEVVNLMGVTE